MPQEKHAVTIFLESENEILILLRSEHVDTYKGTWAGISGIIDKDKTPDEQAAIEATFSSLVNSLAGLNLVHDPGFLEGAMIGSLEMLVITNEIAGMVKRFMKGIPVNEETLAEEVIHQVGPGGHFLAEEHTLK